MEYLHRLLFKQSTPHFDRGAITIAETLIVLGVAAAMAAIYTNSKTYQLEIESSKRTGQLIAAYSRAAATWLVEDAPTVNGQYTIASLQNCADLNGARFLPCNFNADTLLPRLFNADGSRRTLGDLIIDVTVNADGVEGDIDFGVFRSGEDYNGDGLPDSRPDLAAAGFRVANEETGAGVMNFFRLSLAREDASNVVFDPSVANFDQTAIDDLARVQAQVGANVETPFLRLDGSNEMTGGLTFVNGMQMKMTGNGLDFQGQGDIGIQTDTGKLVVSETLQAELMTANIATIDSLTVTPKDGVSGAGFDRFDQSDDITRLDTTISDHEARITDNRAQLLTNRSKITINRNNIESNSKDIATNKQNITNNTANISINRTLTQTNHDNISDNYDSISTIKATLLGHTTRLDDYEGRLNTLENRPVPPSTCTPTLTAALAAKQASGWTSIDSLSHSCLSNQCWVRTRLSSVKTIRYKTRDSSTLKCVSHSDDYISGCRSEKHPNCVI